MKAEPQAAYRADRDFFVLVVTARVIAAAMTELGFADKSSQPVKCTLPENLQHQSKLVKLQYLHKASSLIVDKFVFDDDSVNGLLDQILRAQETQDAFDDQPKTADGRFPCRFPGCDYSFKHDGDSRRRHEATHNPPPVISEDASPVENQSKSTTKDSYQPTDVSSDDDYNYNCAFLADGLFFMNFLDAVSEGDGPRLIRQYRYMMLYCRADGHVGEEFVTSPKSVCVGGYSFECGSRLLRDHRPYPLVDTHGIQSIQRPPPENI